MWPYQPSLKALKQSCPSKADGRNWDAELKYRQDCKHIIIRTGEELKLPLPTQHRAVVLLHRYFSRDSSVKCTGLQKWAVAVACLFLATKIDSSYHRLESVVHAAYVQLKQFQNKPLDEEYYYYAPDRVTQQLQRAPGNPAFLSKLAGQVRDAEMDLIFIINFDFNIEVASTMAIYELRELGLTEALAARDARVRAVRELAAKTAALSTVSPKSAICLMYPPRQVALAAISWACGCHGVPLDLGKVDGSGYTPVVTQEQLEVVIKMLSKPQVPGSRQTTPNPDSGAGGAAAAAHNSSAAAAAAAAGTTGAPSSHGSGTATNTALNGVAEQQQGFDGSSGGAVKGAGLATGSGGACAAGQAVRGCSLGDGSACDAITTGPRIAPSPISPDSETGPDAAAAAALHLQQRQQCGKRRHEDTFAADPHRQQAAAQQQQQQLLMMCAKRPRDEGYVAA